MAIWSEETHYQLIQNNIIITLCSHVTFIILSHYLQQCVIRFFIIWTKPSSYNLNLSGLWALSVTPNYATLFELLDDWCFQHVNLNGKRFQIFRFYSFSYLMTSTHYSPLLVWRDTASCAGTAVARVSLEFLLRCYGMFKCSIFLQQRQWEETPQGGLCVHCGSVGTNELLYNFKGMNYNS